jgi:hypothetical protein
VSFVEIHLLQPVWVAGANGAVAKIIASTVTYPYQVIKSRLQQRDPPAVTIESVKAAAVTASNSSSSGAGSSVARGASAQIAEPSVGPSSSIVSDSVHIGRGSISSNSASAVLPEAGNATTTAVSVDNMNSSSNGNGYKSYVGKPRYTGTIDCVMKIYR